MRYEEKKALSHARMEHAAECLSAASSLLLSGNYKKRGGVIAEFRRLYVKTGVFDGDMSKTISVLFDVRTESDYDDFFIISKEEVVQ